MVAAGSSRGPDTWQPTRYLEPNKPDNEEVLEQAAYQAAVTKQGGDNRNRRYKPRRTVDYMGPMTKWRIDTKLKAVDYMAAIHPNPSDLIGLLPPRAHAMNPSTSICDHFVHTSINKERSPTRVVKWTPDARRLLTGNDKGQFTLWNGQSFNYESITQVHDDSIRHLAYAHNGQGLVSTDKSGQIKYFTPHLTNVHGFQGHREACHGVAWSPNDEKFVTGGDDGLVKIWNYRQAAEEKALSGHGWDVRCVDWHPTKGLVVSGSKDMLVKFWDPRSGKELSTLHSHKATINACNWSPDGHLVATAGGNGQVHLFDIRTFRELDVMKGHTQEVNCIEWHPIHHSLFVTGDAAGTINYYSLTNPEPSEPVTSLVEAHEDAVFSLAFHPLGHLLCSGSKDFTARFWVRARPAGGQEMDRWHIGEARALEMKAEGRDGVTMRVWGGANRKEEETKKTDGPLPGLPGLSNLAALADVKMPPPAQSTSPTYGSNGSGGLPGFGAKPNGGGGGGGAGWQRSQPLPSQDEVRSAPARTGGYDDRGPPLRRDQGFNRNSRDMSDGPSRSGPYDRPPLPPPSGGYGPPPGGYNSGPAPSQAPFGGMPPPAPSAYPNMNAPRPPPPSSMPPFAAGRPPFPPSQYPPQNQGYPPPPGPNYPPPPQQGGFRPPPPQSHYGGPPPNQGGGSYGGGYGR